MHPFFERLVNACKAGKIGWLMVALIAGIAAPAAAAVTSLRTTSDPGDSIGGGQSYFFTPADGTFTGMQNPSNTVQITFRTPAFEHTFTLIFAAPDNQPLQQGVYSNAMRYIPGMPVIDISAESRGCNGTSGNFDVKQVVYGPSNQLQVFWATFEQHCEFATPALRGEIRFNADVPVALTAPSSVTATAGETISFTVIATEHLNGPVTLSATNLPAGAIFTDQGTNTGQFSWVSARSQAGIFPVTFHAQNEVGAVDELVTVLTVRPPNDDFEHATVITTLPFTDALNVATATSTNDPIVCAGSVANTVWYRLALNRTARLEANTLGSDYQTVVAFFQETATGLEALACTSGDGSGPTQKFNTEPGIVYYLMVNSVYPHGSNLVFSINEVLPPINDDFVDAITLTTPSTNVADLELSTREPDDPENCVRGGTVWYSITPTEDSFIKVTILQSDSFDTGISAYSGTRGALQTFGCFGGEFGFPALAGQTYYLMVASTSTGEPRFVFSVRSFPLLKIGVTIDPVGSVDSRTGLVTISGTVTSSQPATIFLEGTVRQRAGRFHLIEAEFGGFPRTVEIPTDGQARWSVQVVGEEGSFGGGNVLVQLRAGGYDAPVGQAAVADAVQTVKLRGRK